MVNICEAVKFHGFANSLKKGNLNLFFFSHPSISFFFFNFWHWIDRQVLSHFVLFGGESFGFDNGIFGGFCQTHHTPIGSDLSRSNEDNVEQFFSISPLGSGQPSCSTELPDKQQRNANVPRFFPPKWQLRLRSQTTIPNQQHVPSAAATRQVTKISESENHQRPMSTQSGRKRKFYCWSLRHNQNFGPFSRYVLVSYPCGSQQWI